VDLVDKIIQSDGFISVSTLNTQECKAAAVLLQRGVLFEHNGHYYLPAECLVGEIGDSVFFLEIGDSVFFLE
jgi:hypothetical protein